MNKFDSILDLIRDSTLIQLRPREVSSEGARLWGQLELQLPGGMKDRVALQIVEDAERSRELRPGSVIIESSSGSTAEGLARVGAAKGYRVIIVTDPRLDEITIGIVLEVYSEERAFVPITHISDQIDVKVTQATCGGSYIFFPPAYRVCKKVGFHVFRSAARSICSRHEQVAITVG